MLGNMMEVQYHSKVTWQSCIPSREMIPVSRDTILLRETRFASREMQTLECSSADYHTRNWLASGHILVTLLWRKQSNKFARTIANFAFQFANVFSYTRDIWILFGSAGKLASSSENSSNQYMHSLWGQFLPWSSHSLWWRASARKGINWWKTPPSFSSNKPNWHLLVQQLKTHDTTHVESSLFSHLGRRDSRLAGQEALLMGRESHLARRK